MVSSKLPRFSDLYTLSIESADPKSISAGKPVEFTKSVTKWYLPFHSTFFRPLLSHLQTDLQSFYISNLLKYCRFTKDGVLVEGLFWKDVEVLIDDYAAEPKKKK